MIVTDGFSKPIPNTMTGRNEPKKVIQDIRGIPSTMINDPKYATSPKLRGPPNTLTQIDGIGGYMTQAIGNPGSQGTGTVGSGPVDPKYATSPNLRGPPNTLTQTDGIGEFRTQAIGSPDSPGIGTVGPNYGSGNPSEGGPSFPSFRPLAQVNPNQMEDGNPKKMLYNQTSKINENLANMQMSINRSMLSTSLLKTKIKAKKEMKDSIALTYDKNFNISGAKVKRKGQIKKGLKYSLAGNQLKEDERGIIRRKTNNQ